MAIVRIRWNHRLDREVDAEALLRDACLEVAPELDLDPCRLLGARSTWLVSLADGSVYDMSPFTTDTPLRDFIWNAPEREVLLGEADLCSHGSPWVPQLGFVCGRC